MTKDQRALGDLASIGPAVLKDFAVLEIRSVAELAQCDAQNLYDRLCRITKARHDPCVLDTFACAIAQARDPQLPAEQRQWWYWSHLRKQASVLISTCSLVLTVHAAAPTVTSAYTDLAKCKTTDSSEMHPGDNPDFFASTCPSFGGYRIELNGSDARSWVVLKRGALQWDTRNIGADQLSGHFPQVAAKVIEWRTRPGSKEPHALIVRLETQNEQTLKDEQWLAVMRVQPSAVRVAGVIKASGNPQANQQARDLADAL